MVFNLNGKESYLVAYLTLLFLKVVQLIATFFTFYNHTLISLFVNYLYPINIMFLIICKKFVMVFALVPSLVHFLNKKAVGSGRVGLSGLFFVVDIPI
jgi:hypothetical protein